MMATGLASRFIIPGANAAAGEQLGSATAHVHGRRAPPVCRSVQNLAGPRMLINAVLAHPCRTRRIYLRRIGCASCRAGSRAMLNIVPL